MRKWAKISELCEKLAHRTYEPGEFGSDLTCICYAPNIGYRSWIFRYKGVYVALFDAGNDNYDFHTAVSVTDVIVAKLFNRFPKLEAFWEKQLTNETK